MAGLLKRCVICRGNCREELGGGEATEVCEGVKLRTTLHSVILGVDFLFVPSCVSYRSLQARQTIHEKTKAT